MSDIQTPLDGTEEEKVTPQTDSEPAAPPVAPPAPPIDYEEKFKQSSREAQVLAEQLEQEKQRKSKPLTIDPTEQELRDLYPDWDTFLPSEKLFAKKNLTLERTVLATNQSVAAMQAEQAWQKDFKNVVKAFPQMAGREEEFEKFVFKPTHRGVSVEALAKAFLYDATKDMPPTPPTPPPQGGLERGGTGPQEPPKQKGLTAAELGALRNNDYPAWQRYIASHDIPDDL